MVSFSTSEYRCDALLLTEHGITPLELSGLTQDTLISHARSFHQAVDTANDPNAGMADRATAQAKLHEILQWLWDTSAGPVLNALGYDSRPAPGKEWPRVWWATGGMLGLLPIHAAGYHTDPADQAARAVMDRVISSWTPTIRALRYARQHTPAPDTKDSALIVAMPVTPGVPGRLHYVPDEAAMLLARLDHPVLLAEPGTPDEWATASIGTPTKMNVLARLASCPIVHFACHGASHPANPSQSRLLLYDHESDPLTVASLAPIKLDRARLAYLSACRTAITTTVELLDEAIHLASAFQLAGFPCVIGTLWEINDALAVQVAEAFYTALSASEGGIDTSRAAHALHQAVLAVRASRPAAPSLWAAYQHAGG